jgi:hypothetical protein
VILEKITIRQTDRQFDNLQHDKYDLPGKTALDLRRKWLTFITALSELMLQEEILQRFICTL